MHDSEIPTSGPLVRRLLQSQHPRLADLPIERVTSAGTDNAMYRLGDQLVVRLPLVAWAVEMVHKEQTWLPELAPLLPLAIPRPIAIGAPDVDFPHPWTILEWLPGDVVRIDENVASDRVARSLGGFVRTLQQIDTTDGPTHTRARPIRAADEEVRSAITHLRGEVDAAALQRAWDRVLEVPDHAGPPAWCHGDLGGLNLLAQDGDVTAVIDWGTCGVGDPASDCRVAWNLLAAADRELYRGIIGVDDATWERGKGWVLSAVTAIPYYRTSNPTLVAQAITGIEAVLHDL